MEPPAMNGGNQDPCADPVPFASNYQLEAFEEAMKQNTIVFLETGSGKTLIAIMLLRSYAYVLRKPSPFIAVFLVPHVVLVEQQAKAIMMHTDLKVGQFWGEMGVDYWDAATWEQQQNAYEVLVMTPAILLDALRHTFLTLDKIKVLIFDECHNARWKDPYACIMKMAGWKAEYLAGSLSQLQSQSRKEQNKIVEEFQRGTVNVMVANSILEEGLDVQSCNIVTRFDPSATICSFIESPGLARKQNSDFIIMKDRYFKPCTRFVIDKASETCTLHIPKSCRIQNVEFQGDTKIVKQLAGLEVCKRLHLVGASTDNLVPDIVEGESNEQESGSKYNEEQVQYFPPELIHDQNDKSEILYYCYLLELQKNFHRETRLHDVLLAVRSSLEVHDESMAIDLVDNSCGSISARYIGVMRLAPEKVLICRRFQVTLLRILLDHNLNKLDEALGTSERKGDLISFDYLLLPVKNSQKEPSVDWNSVYSVRLPSIHDSDRHVQCLCGGDNGYHVNTKSGLVCSCMLQNSLVCTPHNGRTYYISHTLHGLDGNSSLKLKRGEVTTYQDYYKKRHNIKLDYEGQSLLYARSVVTVRNYLLKFRKRKMKGPSNVSVELPPELCLIVMSPIPLATIYSFSYIPSIMHRIESLLLAANLKKMHLDHCTKNVTIPTIKVLEAITTKKCQEQLHLESLETLGDSFLKYAASQQLFKTFQNHQEGLLSVGKEKIISNNALCELGRDRKILGFIRNEPFDLKMWIIPGDNSVAYTLEEEELSPTRKVYSRGRRKLKSKKVADVVEALIGAFLSAGGEMAALSFMDWLGIKIDFDIVPYVRPLPVCPEKYVNLRYLESLLNYSFNDASLLVEALTHGSYMLPEIPRCYQRLEFLGDAVLDYLITVHFYDKYPGLSPGLLTDLRSASVNNNCYAHSALKFGLHKHILLASHELQRQLVTSFNNFDPSSSASTFGWESDTTFPKLLGDIIESLAGAIFVDSNYKKERVFESIRPLLEPLVTLESLRLNPSRELSELCDKEGYKKKKFVPSCENGVYFGTMEVEANGVLYKHAGSAPNKRTAKRFACCGVLKKLKENMQSSA